jgi:hypothetical protein
VLFAGTQFFVKEKKVPAGESQQMWGGNRGWLTHYGFAGVAGILQFELFEVARIKENLVFPNT